MGRMERTEKMVHRVHQESLVGKAPQVSLEERDEREKMDLLALWDQKENKETKAPQEKEDLEESGVPMDNPDLQALSARQVLLAQTETKERTVVEVLKANVVHKVLMAK